MRLAARLRPFLLTSSKNLPQRQTRDTSRFSLYDEALMNLEDACALSVSIEYFSEMASHAERFDTDKGLKAPAEN
jgi:hypothetical protein